MAHLHRSRTRMFVTLIVLLAAITAVAVAVAVVLAACGKPPAPARTPVAVVEPWCIDPESMTLLDDDWCERDADVDGFIDGQLLVPEPGWVKPSKGGRLPPQVVLDPARTVRIPVQVSPQPKTTAPQKIKPGASSTVKAPTRSKFR